MMYAVRHTTEYRYADPVVLCQNQACVQPRTTAGQRCTDFTLEITPEPLVRRPWTDYFGNRIWYFAFDQPHRVLSVTARSRVARTAAPPLDPGQTPAWEWCQQRFWQPTDIGTRRACQFVAESPFVRYLPEAVAYARPSFVPGRPILFALLDLIERVHRDFKYDPRATALNTPTIELFRRRRGVCQDFSHLGICCLRSLGLAARYVSGYLLTDPPPGQQKMVGADASHAWLSAYCPGIGWIDVDPTNNCLPGDKHVVTAWGRDYGDVTPVRGVFIGGGRHTMTVAVDVIPVDPSA